MDALETALAIALAVGVPVLCCAVLLYLAAFLGTREARKRWRSPVWIFVLLPAPVIVFIASVLHGGPPPRQSILNDSYIYIAVTLMLVQIIASVFATGKEIPSRFDTSTTDKALIAAVRLGGIVSAIAVLFLIDGTAVVLGGCGIAGVCF